jgi:hypothetical protein
MEKMNSVYFSIPHRLSGAVLVAAVYIQPYRANSVDCNDLLLNLDYKNKMI